MATSMNMKQLEKLLNNLPDDRQPLARNLFDELQFMKQTMAELKQQVKDEGTIQMFTQGQNTYPRENPALTAYNKTIGRYNQTYKQLVDLLPKEDKGQTDELTDFLEA